MSNCRPTEKHSCTPSGLGAFPTDISENEMLFCVVILVDVMLVTILDCIRIVHSQEGLLRRDEVRVHQLQHVACLRNQPSSHIHAHVFQQVQQILVRDEAELAFEMSVLGQVTASTRLLSAIAGSAAEHLTCETAKEKQTDKSETAVTHDGLSGREQISPCRERARRSQGTAETIESGTHPRRTKITVEENTEEW
jgi:hypothetical protein